MSLTKDILTDIKDGVILSDRSRYSHNVAYDIYLSYTILDPYGLRDVAVSVVNGQRTSLLLREGDGVFALFGNSDYECFRDLLTRHWTDVKEIYALPGTDMSHVAAILNLIEVKAV